jgi:hypothetical protein
MTRPPRVRVSEKAEQQAIVDLLRLIGAQVYVLGTRRRRGDFPGTMQTPGIPDLYAFLPTKSIAVQYQPLWIEVKTTTGRASVAQAQFAWHCEMGGLPYVRGTADDVTRYLKAEGYLR